MAGATPVPPRSGEGHLVGLVGEGIGASLTPPMHEREAALLGLAYEYRVLDQAGTGRTVADVATILAEVERAGYDAINVTHPFKQAVLEHLDRLEPSAAAVGAANLVLLRDGLRIGANTDVSGFRGALRDGLPGARVERVVQFGAGGAGSAAALALLDHGVQDLVLVDPDRRRAEALAERAAAAHPGRRIAVATAPEAADAVQAADGVLNATPLGMAIHPGAAFDVARTADGAWIADVVYRPLRTALLAQAEAHGRPTLDGGRMAVGQAVDSLRLITGLEPDADRMREHFLTMVAAEAPAAEVPPA